MANSLLQFRIDSRLKEEASNLYAQLGLDLPTAIRIFLTRSVQVRGIPFVMQLPAEDADANAAVSAMKRMSAISAENGNSEMTLEEINAEIDTVRKKTDVISFLNPLLKIIFELYEKKVKGAIPLTAKAASVLVQVMISCTQSHTLHTLPCNPP